MTTWYRRSTWAAPPWTYSVRPDLWPPGSMVYTSQTTLADWDVYGRPAGAVCFWPTLGQPGAAEALVLGGDLVQGHSAGQGVHSAARRSLAGLLDILD